MNMIKIKVLILGINIMCAMFSDLCRFGCDGVGVEKDTCNLPVAVYASRPL